MTLIELAEQGLLPDSLISWGIRRLNKRRLRAIEIREPELEMRALSQFLCDMRQSPIAIETHKPNEQHYEVPAAFFERILGNHMKYSACYWPREVKSLDEAENAMLELTCNRAQLENGMEILDLGCGWGSLSLWVAARYPQCRLMAVSNSRFQGSFIRERCQHRGLHNVEVITSDMNHFAPERQFDRIISIEMFEHLRNWEQLLSRIESWLKPAGRLFVHVFSHRRLAYTFEEEGEDNWMGRYFFTAGMMPSDSLILYHQRDLAVEAHWRLNGTHYERTARAWLANLDANRKQLLVLLRGVYGAKEAKRWLQRWRIFFLACAELFGYSSGSEWIVSQYRLSKRS